MRRTLPLSRLLPLLFGLLAASTAHAQDNRVAVEVTSGSIAATGDRATLQVSVENGTGVAVRLVGLNAEYDTPAGDTVFFSSTDALDTRVEAGETAEPDVACTTEYAEGTWVDWPNPYTLDFALGADIAALQARVESIGNRPDPVAAALGDVNALAIQLRRANERFPERVAALSDRDAWFDTAAVEALREPLEQALCSALGRTVTGARGGEARVTAYRAAVEQLAAQSLYTDCLPEDARLAAARALVSTGSAQDALVLTVRDDDGNVVDEWRDVYLAGRLALASQAADAEVYGQFRPALESLGEVQRLDPENPQLGELAQRVLNRAATKVDQMIGEQDELDALQLVELMRQQFPDHPATQRASEAMIRALLPFAQRSLAEGHPVRANNAYVRGLALFADLPAWQEVGPQIQQARGDYLVQQAQSALDDGRLDEAEEMLHDAEQLAPVDSAVSRSIEDQLLVARWSALRARLDDGAYEEVMAKAQELLDGAEHPEVLGEDKDALYLQVATSIWDHYGMLAGIASRTRLGLAEEALELGKAADPELASSLKTRFFIARWLFPALIGFVVIVGGLVVLLRGRWRKRRKARHLWRAGLANAERGELGKAASQLDRAWTILETDPNAAPLVGEETRGHLVLRIAAVHDQRGRKDQVQEMREEWDLLSEFERPYDQDFDTALGQLRG